MRKTNLFYLEGNNSNFLSFSNYGEYLTGVHLSTDHKIFPSRFLCLDLPFDTNDKSIKNFKKFLTCYYENKLAELRDYLTDQSNKNSENYMVELSYLLEGIILFFGLETSGLKIKYYGDIVEHDYNGSYSDSICIVDLGRWLESDGTIKLIKEHNLFTGDTNSTLYNWDSSEYNEILSEYHPIYDLQKIDNTDDSNINTEDNTQLLYNIQNNCQTENNSSILSFINHTILNNSSENDSNIDFLEFNCIIPLFDVLDINIKTNSDIINDLNENKDKIDLSISTMNNQYAIYMNIPYGIWIYPINDQNYNHKIRLEKHENYNQSWSLLIASKFAPYPYGVKLEEEVQKPIEQYTYAELLTYMSKILDQYDKMSTEYLNLINRIDNIEKILQTYIKLDIDELAKIYETKLREFKLNIDSEINQVKLRLADFKWKNIIEATEI